MYSPYIAQTMTMPVYELAKVLRNFDPLVLDILLPDNKANVLSLMIADQSDNSIV